MAFFVAVIGGIWFFIVIAAMMSGRSHRHDNRTEGEAMRLEHECPNGLIVQY